MTEDALTAFFAASLPAVAGIVYVLMESFYKKKYVLRIQSLEENARELGHELQHQRVLIDELSCAHMVLPARPPPPPPPVAVAVSTVSWADEIGHSPAYQERKTE